MIILGTLAAALVLAGCRGLGPTLARSPDSASSTETTVSPTATPSPTPGNPIGTAPASGGPGGAPSPTGPPTFVIEPTTTIASDQTPANTIVGTVTVTSAGPCYLIETDDGHPYALYGSAGVVNRGQRVRAFTAPMTATVDCGPGVLVRLVKLDV